MLSQGRQIAGPERLAYALLLLAPALPVARSLLQVLNGATLAQDGRSGLGAEATWEGEEAPVANIARAATQVSPNRFACSCDAALGPTPPSQAR